MAQVKLHKSIHPSRGRILMLVICLLLLYVAVPQIGSLSDSLAILGRAEWPLVAMAAVMVGATYIAATGIYQLLALRRLTFGRTLAVQGSSAFANRVLPAGLGGLTLNVQYLRKAGHRLPQALAVAAANNLLGFAGHLLLVAIALSASGNHLLEQMALPELQYGWYAAGTAAAGITAVVLLRRIRRVIAAFVADVMVVLAGYRKRLPRLLGALLCSLSLTLLYVAVFYLSAQAVGASFSPLQALIIFTVGMAVGTATPTPGGLGGVEAGLVAGSVAYGETASVALAAALLYRLLTYWLPLFPGFVLLLFIRNKYL